MRISYSVHCFAGFRPSKPPKAFGFHISFQGRSSTLQHLICDNSKMYYQRSRKKNKSDIDWKSRRAQSAECNKNEDKPTLSYDEIEQVLQGIRSRSSSRPPPPATPPPAPPEGVLNDIRSRSSSRPPPPRATPPPLPKVEFEFSRQN